MTAMWIALFVIAAALVLMVALALFERLVPRRVRHRLWRVSVPWIRPFAGFVPGWALLETIGRRSGRPRRVPVGGRLEGETFWFVVGYSKDTQYVRNIVSDPRVRVRVRGRWRHGTAHICEDDDPRKRLRKLNPINSVYLLMAASDFLTVRLDLEKR